MNYSSRFGIVGAALLTALGAYTAIAATSEKPKPTATPYQEIGEGIDARGEFLQGEGFTAPPPLEGGGKGSPKPTPTRELVGFESGSPYDASQPIQTPTPVTLTKNSPELSDLLRGITGNVATVRIYDRGPPGRGPTDIVVGYDSKGKEIFRAFYLARPSSEEDFGTGGEQGGGLRKERPSTKPTPEFKEKEEGIEVEEEPKFDAPPPT